MKKIIVFFVLTITCLASLQGQKGNQKILITGRVTDDMKQPVMNAIILIDNEKTNTLTDQDGRYRVRVKPGAVRIGVVTFTNGLREEDIGGRTVINFSFDNSPPQRLGDQALTVEQKARIDEESYVDVGYSSTKKKNLTDQVSTIDATKKKKTYSSIYEMLQELPGVRIIGNQVNVLDSRTLQGHVPPLYVVDGIYVDDISLIKPNMVESISVLKGGNAAMYGSRGYGGVILIKTKTAQVDK